MIDSYSLLQTVREKKPLIHHLTNWVTIYDCANVTRTIGALPVMAHAPEEVAQMAGAASALVLNIGTLTKDFIDSMIRAGKAANKKGIPIILDAVGAGATDLRTAECKRLLKELKIDIIKGNAGEIATLAGVKAEVRGVESVSAGGEPEKIAATLAKAANATVVITGKVDIVAGPDGKVYKISNGHEMMGKVVGTGCMAASVIASFAAVEKNYAKAAACALACFGIAGELAAKESKGPGTFKVNFFDALHNLDKKQVTGMAMISSL